MKVFLFLILCIVIFMSGLILFESLKEFNKFVNLKTVFRPLFKWCSTKGKNPKINIKEVLQKHK